MSLTQREAFARLMEHMCRHDGDGGHGYSQVNRLGDGTTEPVSLGDGVTVTVAGGDRDCSSGIITCLQAVGVDTHEASYTGNMRSELLRSGLFRWHPMGDGYVARRGDIYLNERHHTAMCTSADPDMLAQFSRSETGGITGRKGDQDCYESNIRGYYNYPWDGKLAWVGDGSTIGGTSTPAASGPVKVDGYWGINTTLRAQRVAGTPVDGVVSSQDAGWRSILPGCTTGWEWSRDPRGSQLVQAVQRACGVKPDGLFGRDTANAFIRRYGNGVCDGRLDAPSIAIKGFQRAINEGHL